MNNIKIPPRLLELIGYLESESPFMSEEYTIEDDGTIGTVEFERLIDAIYGEEGWYEDMAKNARLVRGELEKFHKGQDTSSSDDEAWDKYVENDDIREVE